MHFRQLAILATTLATMAAAANPAMIIKESVSAPPQWVRRGPAPDDYTIILDIALKQRAVSDLEDKLMEIADPDSAEYGKWLSQEEVKSFLEPESESINAVKRWLQENGVQEDIQKRSESSSGDWMNAQVTVAQARKLLGNADFAVWEHQSTGEQLVRAIEYSLPKSVSDHIDLIGPTTYFHQIRALNKAGNEFSSTALTREQIEFVYKSAAADDDDDDDDGNLASTHHKKMKKVHKGKKTHKSNASSKTSTDSREPNSCNISIVTFKCLRQFYRTHSYIVENPKKQLIGISGFLNQYASYSDLKKFFKTQRKIAYQTKYKFETVLTNNGTYDESDPGGEANGDVQAVGAVAYSIPMRFYSTKGSPPFKVNRVYDYNTNEPYHTQFQYLLNLSDHELPDILSISYGDYEQTVPHRYQRRVCQEIAALGARGTTVFFSSGDTGVGPDGDCVSNDGKKKHMFLPTFPASCPYVTAVGATEQFRPERAAGPVAGFHSGGGFSNTFRRPKYQEKAVDCYLNKIGNLHKGLYNTSGRAYPDISAQGSKFFTILNGEMKSFSGTSAACPLTASIFALVNDKRITAGKRKLGFVNPLIYKKGNEAFHDITIGESKGCSTSGFPAEKGWDPVTGWGTPDFHKLSKAFMQCG